ncbi:caspase family protein [Streptomyces sp. 6N223]|uniref:caspase family protein n=1 Tax=Streptomyces sp. 6N223 TaxID=3457412 RepID=UPI003FD5AD61
MGRRFFLALGSGRYRNLPDEDQLDGVSTDIAGMTELFEPFGYRRVLPGLGEYDGAEQVRQKLSHWSKDARLTPDDVVVLYFAGHGVVEERDRHYLLCWDSHDDDLAATALATEDLVRILCRGDLRQLLLILDTCSGGAGGAEAAAVALQTLAYRHSGDNVSTSLYFLASARRKDVAQDGAFAGALRAAIQTTTERTGQRQRYLDLTELVKAVNERFEEESHGQRAELACGLVTGLAPFLPNAGFREDLPPVGTDLEIQRRVTDRDLTEHFGPRSRGVEFESEQGLYFSGRVRVLSELVSWLTASDGDGKGRIVTGSPGCGKSAVLGRIVALSDPVYRTRIDLTGVDPATVVPEGCVTAAVHVRHKRLEEVVARIAAALGSEADGTAALLQDLTRRGRQGRVAIVVDALDEAGSDTAADSGGHGEPRRIARELLRPMSEIPGVRLLVGTRRELVGSLGPTLTVLDLDHRDYRAGEEDVAGYVTKVLLATEEPEVPTPYRGHLALARTVAEGVAARAAGVYLYARTTARTLRSDESPVDVARAGWADALPSEVGGAFDDYLARFGPDEQRVRRMLLALAFSEGKGLPRGRVWTTLSSSISGVECTESDIAWVLDVAKAYIAEVTDSDRRSAYRLYHKALAEHLRASAHQPAAEIQSLIVDALVSMAPRHEEARNATRDWLAAPPYVRQHLATHAEAAHRLTELMGDPGFLLASEPLALLRALGSVEGDEHRRVRSAYEQVAHRLTGDHALSSRAADLQLSARRCGADELADRVNELGVDLPWTARWAWWSTSGTHRLLSGHTRPVECVAVGDLDGRPIAVTGGWDETVRVWDLTTQRQIGEPLKVGTVVMAVAIGEVDDYTVALTGGVDGVVRVWDLSAGHELGAALEGHTSQIEDLATGVIDGRPVVLSASGDGTARLWDLRERRQLGVPLAAHRRTVAACALGTIDGLHIAITGGEDKRAYVWDVGGLFDGRGVLARGPLTGHADGITAVAIGDSDGRAVALLGDDAGMLSLWDLSTRQQIGEPVIAHVTPYAEGVTAAAIGTFEGRPIALTSGKVDTRLWDLRSLRQLDHPLQGHVRNITGSALVERPDGTMAVTASDDYTARVWDLSADQPAAGHTRRVVSVAYALVKGRDMLLTGSEDGTARTWDLRTRAQIGPPMEAHTGGVVSVALGQLQEAAVAVTGGSDGEILAWDPLNGTPLGSPLKGHTNTVSCLALGPLGSRTVVVSGSEDGTVRLWDLDTYEPVMEPLTGHLGSIDHMAVRQAGPDLEIILATTFDHAYLWRVSAGTDGPRARRRHHLDLEDVHDDAKPIGADFLDGSPIVMARRSDNTIHLLDVATAQSAGVIAPGKHTSTIESCSVARVAGEAVVATMGVDGMVGIWSVDKGKTLTERQTRPGLVASWTGAFVHGRVNGRNVGIVGHTTEVRLWDLSTMEPIGEPLCGETRGVVGVAIIPSPEGDLAVTATADGTVRSHQLTDGRQTGPHLVWPPNSTSLTCCTKGSGDKIAVKGSWAVVEAINLWTRQRIARHYGRWVQVGAHTVNGRVLMVATTDDRELHAWDLDDAKGMLFQVATGHGSAIVGLAFGGGVGKELAATASLDGTIRLWDLATGEFCAQWSSDQIRVWALDFGRIDGRDVLFFGDDEGELHFWDIGGDTNVGPSLEPLPGSVRRVRLADVAGRPMAFAADGRELLRIWDLSAAGRFSDVNVGSAINDLSVTASGDLCVATDKGVLALRLGQV